MRDIWLGRGLGKHGLAPFLAIMQPLHTSFIRRAMTDFSETAVNLNNPNKYWIGTKSISNIDPKDLKGALHPYNWSSLMHIMRW